MEGAPPCGEETVYAAKGRRVFLSRARAEPLANHRQEHLADAGKTTCTVPRIFRILSRNTNRGARIQLLPLKTLHLDGLEFGDHCGGCNVECCCVQRLLCARRRRLQLLNCFEFCARLMLETTGVPPPVAASRCGFRTQEQTRREFHRRLGVTPGWIREHFGKVH